MGRGLREDNGDEWVGGHDQNALHTYMKDIIKPSLGVVICNNKNFNFFHMLHDSIYMSSK